MVYWEKLVMGGWKKLDLYWSRQLRRNGFSKFVTPKLTPDCRSFKLISFTFKKNELRTKFHADFI